MKYLETVKIKSISDKGQIEGYASIFNVKDSCSDIVLKNAFSKSIEDFHQGKKPKLLWQHDVSSPIGVIDEIFEDDHGLFIKGHLLLDIPKVREIYLLLKNKAVDGFSIGYRIRNHYIKNNLQYLTDIDLLEISIVTFPACESATIEKVKADKQSNVKDQKEGNTMNLPLSNETNFSEFIRKGTDSFFTKALSEQNDKDGAIFLPQNILMRVEDKLKFLSPIRSIAKIITISSNSIDVIVDSKLPDAGWSAADEERVETDAPEVNKIKILVHELYAKPKANQNLLDDSQVDIEEWLINKISEKIASLEDQAFIDGDGADKPKGILRCDSALGETRAFGQLQHFCTGANGKFASDDAALNVLIDVVCSLKPLHVKNAKWLMSRSALAVIRKLRNKDGVNIWQPSLSEATPSTLLGYPVIVDDNMPILTENTASTSVAFGDFKAGYQIVDRQGLSILRDPYTSKPFVEFYVSKRVGGNVVNFDAIKLLKFSEN